jgi:Ca-activated chloride channel family protein
VRAALNSPQPVPYLRRAGDCAPYLIAVLMLFAWQKVCAQLAPADDFFNGGAQLYISNNVPAALERVEGGLKLYPDDVKLKKLEELLKQQQQSQSQQNQQNQQNQSQQQQQKDQQQQQQQNSSGQQSQPQQNQQQQDKSGQNGSNEQQAAAAQKEEMTPEEAKKLLDAQKGDEKILQLKPQGKPENQNRPIKDW